MIAHVNGRWVDDAEAALSIHDRGFLYGHAVFESVRVHGDGLFRLPDHLRRLEAGAASLRVPLPPPAELEDLARELVRRNRPSADAVVRVTVTAGQGGSAGPGVVLAMTALPADWRARARAGWTLHTAAVPHATPASMPPHIKAPGRVSGMLARFEAADAGADDALLLTPEGLVTEGPSWNVFWRRGDRLCTPAVDVGILAGVTRATVLEVAADAAFTVEEGAFPRADLDAADEVFATMTSLGIVPIRELDGRRLPAQATADRLADLYWRRVAEEAQAVG